MITASASASPARAAALVRMFSPNRNTPSRLAVSGSKMVNPGWEAASGPAANACEASSMVTAPAATSTYSDHAETMAPGPPPRCELSSLMTAAMNPHEIPVAAPSAAARRRAGPAAQAERHGQGRDHDAGGHQPGQQPGGPGSVQPPAGRRGQPEEHAEPGGHGRRGQPVAARDPPRPGDGQVAEDEQQLGRQDGLDQGQVAVAQRGDLEDEPADHGGDAEQPGRLAGQPDQEPGVKARRLGAPGPLALAQRGGGGAHAGRDGQQDGLVHQLAPFAWLVPRWVAGAAASAASWRTQRIRSAAAWG